MWWFGRKRREVWDEEIESPIDDIEAAHRVRDICRSATVSADKNGGSTGRQSRRSKKRQQERYRRAAKAAMEIASKIDDDLLRDASLRQIVGLYIKVDDLDTARTLFRTVQAPSMRAEVLRDHPALEE